MKKFFALLAIFALLFSLAACGDTPAGSSSGSNPPDISVPPDVSVPDVPDVPAEPLHIPELTVELPRELDASAARAAMRNLPDALAVQGVTVDTISISFGPSYGATAEALAQGSVQLAFLPAEELVEFDGMTPLLADADYGFTAVTAADWNAGAARTRELVTGTAALICAGPSTYGNTLADLTALRPLTWAELDHARWGVLAEDDLAGYRCLRLWLEDHYEDNAVSDLSQVTVYDSWDDLLDAAAAEEIDLFPLHPVLHAEAGEVRVLDVSAPLHAWVAAGSAADAAVNDPRFAEALADAVNAVFDPPEAQEAAIGARFYAPVSTEELDSLRRLVLGGG